MIEKTFTTQLLNMTIVYEHVLKHLINHVHAKGVTNKKVRLIK